MLGTWVFVHESGAWHTYHGPVFVNQEKAEAWAVLVVENEAANGRESAVGVWEHSTGRMVYETRMMRIAA